MSSHINLVATISPKPGKFDRVLELMKEIADHVHKTEPDTLRYHINVTGEPGSEEIIMLETYKSKASMDAHVASKEFQDLTKKFENEDLLAAPLGLKFVNPVGGFASRL